MTVELRRLWSQGSEWREAREATAAPATEVMEEAVLGVEGLCSSSWGSGVLGRRSSRSLAWSGCNKVLERRPDTDAETEGEGDAGAWRSHWTPGDGLAC